MKSRPALSAFCLGVLLLGSSCGDGSSGRQLKVPEMNPKTEVEYATAIDTLRDVWRARPRDISEENLQAEQKFIARLSSLANRTKGTGNFKATSVLWKEVITEHQRDYPEQR